MIIKKIIAFLILFGVSACTVTNKSWHPEQNTERYTKAMKEVKRIEPFSAFLKTEKKVITAPTEAYYKARWAFIKDVFFDHPKVDTPNKPLNIFIQFCSKNNFLKQADKPQFLKAAKILGFELITDLVAFKIPANTYKTFRNLPYVAYNGYSQNLDLFLPNAPRIQPVPCIIFIHGGGWEIHKRAWFEAFARYVADKGYAAVTIDYRMLHAVSSPVACVNDAKAAVRWVRANAKKYGIDSNKIGASGASAGAQMAAILATTGDDKSLEGNVGNTQVSSKIQAAVGFATPTMTGTRMTWPWMSGAKPTWYDAISPYKHISKEDAPMKFVHGTADKTVNMEEAKDMYAKYKEVGIETELELIPDKPHVFYMNKKAAESAFQFFKKIFESKK
ncbi:MAG: alpha/beta hydrolase fold domain-containing protein [Polaribacter sp.]